LQHQTDFIEDDVENVVVLPMPAPINVETVTLPRLTISVVSEDTNIAQLDRECPGAEELDN
jgi:hypothetical protein